MRGRFITVDGIEGAGKSSQLITLEKIVSASGRSVLMTREPGGTALGERIRDLLLEHHDDGTIMDADTELLLVFAARSEHLAKIIKPALAAGQWVICDRFTDATYAYQGAGRGIATERIEVIEDWAQATLRPDLTLLFDLPVEVGMMRADKRGSSDRIESETAAFFHRARAAYLARARLAPDRYRIIDADQSMNRVAQAVERAVRPML